STWLLCVKVQPARCRGARRRSLDRHEPQAALVVLGVEVQPVGWQTLGKDHRHRGLELLAHDGRRRYLVDGVLLYISGPARIGTLDARPGVGGALHHVQKLVVVEVDYLGSSHATPPEVGSVLQQNPFVSNAFAARASLPLMRPPPPPPRDNHA